MRAEDAPAARELERLAGAAFRDVGLAWIAEDEPPPVAAFLAHAEGGTGWVALSGEGELVGFVIVEHVDDAVFVEQISVRPDRQRQGIARRLIDTVAGWASALGARTLTLTTFDSVPWNRPVYERLGFVVVSGEELGVGHRAIEAAEAARGLTDRVCMRREI